MVEGNAAADLRRWTRQRRPGWLAGIEVVATDLAESFRAGLSPHLDSRPPGGRPVSCGAGREPLRRSGPPPGPERDARPSRPQGRPAVSDPQAAAHRLRTPRRTRPRTGCCWACASVTPTTRSSAHGWPRNRCATSTSPTTPPTPRCCWTRPSSPAPTTRSPRSARSARRSRRGGPRSSPTTTPARRNGPTEGLNLCVKKVKRCGHGFRTFEHYRLRVLLHAGGVTWPAPTTTTADPNPRAPHSVA